MASSKKTGTAKETPVIYLPDKTKHKMAKTDKTDIAPGTLSAIFALINGCAWTPVLMECAKECSGWGIGFYMVLYAAPIMAVSAIVLLIIDKIVVGHLGATHKGKLSYWMTSGLISLILLHVIILVLPTGLLLDLLGVEVTESTVSAVIVTASLADILVSIWGLVRASRSKYIKISKTAAFWFALVISVLGIILIISAVVFVINL